MKKFQALIGECHGEGKSRWNLPMKISQEAKIERLREFIVFSSVGEPAEVPDSVSIIGGAPEGEPQPMHYFDSRVVKRLLLMALDGSRWKIWRAPAKIGTARRAPASINVSFGEIAADDKTIEGRWERGMGDAGDEWEVDIPIDCSRK